LSKILVVDDQPKNIELLEAYLAPQGYEIITAVNGEEALEKLSGNKIDLILLDIIMPGIDGFEVTRRVRQDNLLRLIPIILVTALRETEDRVKGIEVGCDDFLSKPVDKLELLARVRSLLKVKAYNDLMSNYREELESEVTGRTKELKHTMESLQQEITERKRAEEELTLSETRYRRLFESAKNGILILDAETGKIVDVNPFLVELLGYSREIFIGKAIWEIGFFKVIASSQDKFLELHQKEFVRYENLPLETVDGRLINVEFVSNIYLENNQKKIQYNIRDISDRTKAESQRKSALEDIRILNEQLEQKVTARTRELEDSQLALLNLVEDLNASAKNIAQVNQALEATNKELEAFSYSVSHDLRAPLRGMDGFSQALLEDYSDKLDATGKNYLERIRAGTQHMGLLIDDMLKLSRINRSEFKHESIDLSKMVQAIILSLRQNNPAREVIVNIQKDIIIDGDRHLMEIALTNLMDNAWKFTGKTKNARIKFGTKLIDGKPVMFIRDNGVGFDMTYVDKLFGAFQRLHTTEEFPGTGIGLATVQRVIHRHGGRICAEGEVGKGTVFYFTLP
jgi:PAS domain S-box-containing protein